MRTRPKKKMTVVVQAGKGRVKVEHDGGNTDIRPSARRLNRAWFQHGASSSAQHGSLSEKSVGPRG